AEVLQKCPEMTEAWFLKSDLTDNEDEKIECFEKILEINPAHEAARTSLNSLLTAMKNVGSPTEYGNFQTEEAESFADEAEEFVEENRFEENSQSEKTKNNNSAQNFEFTQISDENDYSTAELNENIYLSAEQESEPNRTGENEDVSFDKKMFFGGETQSVEESFSPFAENRQPETAPDSNAESDESRIEETKTDFVSFTAPEAAFTPSSNYEVETNAVENEYRTEDSDAAENDFAENDFGEQFFQDVNAHSNEFENEETELMNNASPKFAETVEMEETEQEEEYIFAPNDAPTTSETSQPDDGNSSDNFNQENNNMLEVENYHSNNYSAGFDSNEKSVYEKSGVTEVEVAKEFSDEPERQTSPKWQPESVACPFCNAENNAQAFDCGTCRAVLSLSDLEMLLANQTADTEMLGQAVERMERVKNLSGFGENELLYLGIGHINLKNPRQGFSYLQKALQANPNNVLLSSQVNALAIRLEEIERQEEVHDAMIKGKTILVVDDSPTVRKLISGKLEKSGHEVVCAVDGMDALAKLNEIAPDLILLDITMPRMDGYQVCKLIRSNPVTKDIPVVMISGKDGFFDKVRGRMAGTTGYITKPFGPETLMKALDVYIQSGGENVFSVEEAEVLMEV
ncbi:MAG: response regulator, partial [Acidobacteriota bacterium]|nr:response regulator [Acidobacteriota bacterium]